MTTNEMIYKTMNTKLTKEPIYKSVLEDLGYEVYDSTWSYYNNWTVKNKETGKTILLSKHNYTNKKALFDCPFCIETNDIKKVNYVDFLSKNRPNVTRPFFENYIYKNFERSKYSDLRDDIRDSKWDIKYYNRYINETKEKIEKLKKDIEQCNSDIKRYNEKITDTQKKLEDTRQKVAELKKTK